MNLRLQFAVAAFSVAAAFAVCAEDAVVPLDILTASGAHRYEVEIAADESSREHGLMDRHQMASNHGMLFEFQTRAPVTFWMKDTYLPLDMIFVDSDGTVRRVVENAKPLSETTIPSQSPVVAVLELNAGQARAIRLKVGDKLKAPFFKP